MDAAIFIRKFMKICASYQNCDVCPLAQVYCQREEVDEEELVSAVERWGKEHTNGESIVGMMEKMNAPYIRHRKNEVGQVEMILDASWWDAEYNVKMNDLISRADAIKAIETCIAYEYKQYPDDYELGRNQAFEAAISELKDVPSANRPQGEWNPYYTEREHNNIFNCKLCGDTFFVMQGKDDMNFCPNCGARMAEDGNERFN